MHIRLNGYKLLGKSIECLRRFADEQKFREITYENQRRVILNQDIDVAEYVEYRKNNFFHIPFFSGKGS